MTTGVPSPPFIFQGFTGNGALNAFGFVATYQAGTTTPIATYTDATLTTPNQNPVPLNAIGQAPIWLTPGLAYKFIETDSGGNQCGYADNVPGFITGPYLTALLTASYIGGLLYPQTTQESAAGVTPTAYQYPPGDIRRYGAATSLADNTAALNTANSIGITLTIPQGLFKFTGNPVITSPLVFSGGVLQPAAGTTVSVLSSISAGLSQIFDCSQSGASITLGNTTARALSGYFPTEWWGSKGNTKQSLTGYISSTGAPYTLNDPHAAFVQSDVGKTVVVVAPLFTTYASIVTTIASVVSATQVTLASAPTFASQASFQATISNGSGGAGTTMVVANPPTSGTLLPSMALTGVSGSIRYQLSGTTGGAGSYVVSVSQYVSTATPVTGTSVITYYYGTDDTAAILAANASVGSMQLAFGPNTLYNLNAAANALGFNGSSIYIMSQQAVIAGAAGTTAQRWLGINGCPEIVFTIPQNVTSVTFTAPPTGMGATISSWSGGANPSALFGFSDNETRYGSVSVAGVCTWAAALTGTPTTAGTVNITPDCATFGVGGTPVSAGISDITFTCCYTGRIGFVDSGFQSSFLRNVTVNYANRHGVAMTPVSAAFSQQSHRENFSINYPGFHCVYVAPSAGGSSFTNECDWLDFVMQYPSCRTSGGTGICIGGEVNGSAMAIGGCDSWNITNYKCSTGWNGDPNFQPLGCWFFVNTTNSCFVEVGITLENGYCEQGNTAYPIATTVAPFFVAAGASALIRVRGFYNSYWGLSITHADHDAASQFTVTANSTQTLMTMAQYQAYTGDWNISVTDGTNTDRFRLNVIGGGSGAAVITDLTTNNLIGTKSSTGGSLSYTMPTTNTSGNFAVTFHNTGATTLTVSYSAIGKDFGAAPFYVY